MAGCTPNLHDARPSDTKVAKDASTPDLSDGEETLSTVDTLRSESVEGDCKSRAKSPTGTLEFLRLYGFLADNMQLWGSHTADLPVARFRVRVHTELNGHTAYLIECGLTHQGRAEPGITWSTTMRLSHIRRDLHDFIKAWLGFDYARHFGVTPFAHHLGLPGTTSRLHAWFQTLAACMAAGELSPVLAAHVLQVLDAPKLSGARLSLLLHGCG